MGWSRNKSGNLELPLLSSAQVANVFAHLLWCEQRIPIELRPELILIPESNPLGTHGKQTGRDPVPPAPGRDSQSGILGPPTPAFIRLLGAGKNSQKCTLAGSIRTGENNPTAALELDADPVKYDPIPEGLAQASERQEVSWRPSRSESNRGVMLHQLWWLRHGVLLYQAEPFLSHPDISGDSFLHALAEEFMGRLVFIRSSSIVANPATGLVRSESEFLYLLLLRIVGLLPASRVPQSW